MSEDIQAEALVTQVYKGRERQMYPEVAEYLRTYRQVQWGYEDAVAAADQEYSRAERAAMRVAEVEGRRWDYYDNSTDRTAREEYRRARDAAYTAARRARNEAQRTVLDGMINSPHKEVAWIARIILRDRADDAEQTNYARDILAILPATTEQIWEEAKSNRGMCNVFDQYYDQAEAAGVFGNGNAIAAREIAALRSYIRRNYGGDYVGNFMEKLSPILKAYEADYAAKLEAAKAEWQGLDEAWRSERSRRGAATRAANREAQAEEYAEATLDRLATEAPDIATPQPEEIKATIVRNGQFVTSAT